MSMLMFPRRWEDAGLHQQSPRGKQRGHEDDVEAQTACLTEPTPTELLLGEVPSPVWGSRSPPKATCRSLGFRSEGDEGVGCWHHSGAPSELRGQMVLASNTTLFYRWGN